MSTINYCSLPSSTDECIICYDPLNTHVRSIGHVANGSTAKEADAHIFHPNCIIDWVKTGKERCPKCSCELTLNNLINLEGSDYDLKQKMVIWLKIDKYPECYLKAGQLAITISIFFLGNFFMQEIGNLESFGFAEGSIAVLAGLGTTALCRIAEIGMQKICPLPSSQTPTLLGSLLGSILATKEGLTAPYKIITMIPGSYLTAIVVGGIRKGVTAAFDGAPILNVITSTFSASLATAYAIVYKVKETLTADNDLED